LLAIRTVNSEVFLDRSATEPQIASDQALIRPLRVLLSKADAAVCRGELPYEGVLGHQFVGVVEDAKDQSWVGARVVGNVNIAVAGSELARRGLANHDPQRAVLGLNKRDGCLAERFVLETMNLVRVPDEVEDDQAVFATELAAAVHASQIVHIEGKTYVTVLGDGLSGLLSAQVMAKLNASVRLLGLNPQRLELCAKWGIKHRLLSDVGRRLDQDVVIDTTLNPHSLETAMQMVRPRGTIVLKANPIPMLTEIQPLDYAPIIANELNVVGSRCGHIAEGLGAMTTGGIDLSGLITKSFKFEDSINALRTAQDVDQIAVVVTFD
jgi:threonine dehydrogenase-like Zn-dependent dehydrogenase